MEASDFAGSVGRTLGAVLAGVLLSKGIPPEVSSSIAEPATQVFVGVISWFGIQVCSLFAQHNKAKQIQDLKDEKLIALSND